MFPSPLAYIQEYCSSFVKYVQSSTVHFFNLNLRVSSTLSKLYCQKSVIWICTVDVCIQIFVFVFSAFIFCPHYFYCACRGDICFEIKHIKILVIILIIIMFIIILIISLFILSLDLGLMTCGHAVLSLLGLQSTTSTTWFLFEVQLLNIYFKCLCTVTYTSVNWYISSVEKTRNMTEILSTRSRCARGGVCGGLCWHTGAHHIPNMWPDKAGLVFTQPENRRLISS
jgi:hypothetical protein